MSHLGPNSSNATDGDVVTNAGTVGTTEPRGLGAVLRVGFVIALVLFLVGGFVLVGTQAVELTLGNGTAVTTLGEKLGPPTFITATICGLFAFAQEYLRPRRGGENG